MALLDTKVFMHPPEGKAKVVVIYDDGSYEEWERQVTEVYGLVRGFPAADEVG